MPDLLHHVRVVVALYDNDMEALPGGDNDPVPSWDDVMRELQEGHRRCRWQHAGGERGAKP
jgi:hypothetical protein